MTKEWWPDFKSEKLCRAEKVAFREELFGHENNEIPELAIAPLMDKHVYTWQIGREFGKPAEDVMYIYIYIYVYIYIYGTKSKKNLFVIIYI